jgi:3'(2'), 5'-bisphosphate nucleotidase
MADVLLWAAIQAAVDAGREIMAVYATDFGVEKKSDDSPLTLADKRAHATVAKALKPLGLPLLSEEGRNIPFEERKKWSPYWLVDPLDGTKEFIRRNGEFTVNIALVKENHPIMGVVYAPVRDWLYFAEKNKGAYKLTDARHFCEQWAGQGAQTVQSTLYTAAVRLPMADPRERIFTVIGSRSHGTPDMEKYIDRLKIEHGPLDFIATGSSLKFCLVAEGKADIYPCLGPTMEWDTAAGQVVAECAGACVVEHATGVGLAYNKESLLNPWFVVMRPGLSPDGKLSKG